MKELVNKTKRIVNLELFNGKKNKILLDIFVLMALIILQFRDITMKISGNYFAIIWIAINSYYTASLFINSNRDFILYINKLSSLQKIKLILKVVFKINFLWFIFIFIQLLVLKANLVNAFFLSLLQYVFALNLGVFCGLFKRKKLGLAVILIIGLINFIIYNPYKYNAYSHFLSISEQLYNINNINYINMLGLLIFIFFSIITFYLFININNKNKLKKFLVLILGCALLFINIVFYFEKEYDQIQKSSFNRYEYYENTVEYRGVNKKESEALSSIIFQLEKEFSKISGEDIYKGYIIDKKYLPQISWFFREHQEPVLIENENVKINILSLSMLNFTDVNMCSNMIEEIEWNMRDNFKNYNQSRYTRHILEGYKPIILRNISLNLNFDNAHELQESYIGYLNEIYESQVTRYNFVKKISMILYDKYPDTAKNFYEKVVELNPSTDQEFIFIIKDYFNKIWIDKDIQNTINVVLKRKKK